MFIGKNCNPNILDEITTKEEMSGLLNWSLEGLDRLLKHGKFSTSENMEELRKEYIRKSNSAKAYIEECLVYENDPKAILIESELYSEYIKFCKDNKLPSTQKRYFTINMQQFLPQAKQVTERVEGKVKHVWQFIKLREKEPQQTLPTETEKSVTTVTAALLNHTNNILPRELFENDINVVKGESMDLVCLNKPAVTVVTNLETETPPTGNSTLAETTCFLCLKAIPEDHKDTTILDGKWVHIPCFARAS